MDRRGLTEVEKSISKILYCKIIFIIVPYLKSNQLHLALQTVSFHPHQAKNSLLTLAASGHILASAPISILQEKRQNKNHPLFLKPYLLCRRPNVNILQRKSFVKTLLGFGGALHYFFSEVRVAGDGGIYPECLFWCFETPGSGL